MSNNLFGGMTKEGLEKTEDRIGGFKVYDTDIYTVKIKMAFGGKHPGGAKFANFTFDINGAEYRETIWVSNKKGENFFPNKDDPTKKVALPGFTTVDEICLCTVGKSLSEMELEEKIVKVWDPETKANVNKSVPVFVELLNEEVSLGIVKNLENKSQKQGNEYVATADTRDTNSIEKVFNTESKATVVEARIAEETGKELVAEFWDKWLDKNKGVTRDKRTIKDGSGGQSGRPGSRATPPQAGSSISSQGSAPKRSLFAKG